jgi:hypothetical protein
MILERTLCFLPPPVSLSDRGREFRFPHAIARNAYRQHLEGKLCFTVTRQALPQCDSGGNVKPMNAHVESCQCCPDDSRCTRVSGDHQHQHPE